MSKVYGFKDKKTAERLRDFAAVSEPQSSPGGVKPIKGQGWLLKTPAGGIPKQSADTSGSADCIVYMIDHTTGGLTKRTDSAGGDVAVTVYNITESDIAGNTFITAKVVDGKAIADVGGAGGGGQLCQTPPGGIDGRNGNMAGVAACSIWTVAEGNGELTDTEQNILVFNPWRLPVAESVFITIKKVDSDWVVDAEDCPGDPRAGQEMYYQGNWQPASLDASGTYQVNDVVMDFPWTMIANKTTTDRPAPQPAGAEVYLYGGTMTEAPQSAKQIIFGNRYTWGVTGITRGYRVLTTTGNNYQVFSVTDPLGTPVINQLASFTASIDGWTELNVSPGLVSAGQVFDLVALVTEPDPTPTTFTANYNYQTPNNAATPGIGNISHANRALASLRINKTDDDGGTPALGTLTVGDVIQGPSLRWSIQSITDNGTWIDFGVAPAQQDSPDGVASFTFETVTATPITLGSDTNYWGLNPLPSGSVQGLLGVDIPYDSITPNSTAYGTDIRVQALSQSDDWDLLAFSNFS